MARRHRQQPAGTFQHVLNRGVKRRAIFHKDGDYSAFLQILKEARDKFDMRLIAFCLMVNHWHLVLRLSDTVSLSTYMHWVTSTHVRRYHQHYGIVGSGHLYQARYRNDVCKDERRVLAVMRYVEANPLKAKMVKRSEEWPWSSLALRINGDPDDLLAESPITLPRNWSEYVDQVTLLNGKPT